MRSAAILLLACMTSAAEETASPSLRGGRSSDVVENVTQPGSASSIGMDSGADEGDLVHDDFATWALNMSDLSEGDLSDGNVTMNASELLPLLKRARGWHGWAQGGEKVWGVGTGVESVNSGNAGYYNRGMSVARALCGGADCALMVNPPGHRTVEQFHIHFAHYAGYGASLKRRLEEKVCSRGGWHGGGLPCSGKAAFFPGFPGVFSVAMSGGSIQGASVIAWPSSCGGRGTIVQLAYGCSIEHQIRGDYNPNHR